MCRNIKTLYNFAPPATEEEIHNASLQFVRKITGFRDPSAVNTPAFNRAVQRISQETYQLLQTLTTVAKPRNREEEAAKARVRALQRFGRQ